MAKVRNNLFRLRTVRKPRKEKSATFCGFFLLSIVFFVNICYYNIYKYNRCTMVIIAFDIGDKRIGVACTDPLCMMALPVETYFRKRTEEDVKYLAALAKSRNADLIVCGMPVNFDGSESIQTEKTRKFIELLSKQTDIPIELEDERFTTMEARRLLLEADMRRDKRKQVIDKVAASYILEGYLNKMNKNK